MNTNKRLFLLFVMISASVAAFAQDAVLKAVDEANKQIVIKEYTKAFSYVQFVIRYYRDRDMPSDALETCERAVGLYADSLKAKESWPELLKLEDALANAPKSVKDKAVSAISLAREKIRAAEADKQKKDEEDRRLAAETKERALSAERAKADEAQRAQLDRVLAESRKLEELKEKARIEERLTSERQRGDLEKKRLEAEASYREELSKLLELSKKGEVESLQSVSRTSLLVVVGLGILGLLAIAGISLIVVVSLRQQKVQQEQFKSTLLGLQALSRSSLSDTLALPFASTGSVPVQALPAPHLALPDGSQGLPPSPEELKLLMAKCQDYATEIDRVTNRKNTSRLVAELVFKISKNLGYAEVDCYSYFSVALVYDIGFLNIDPALLRAEQIDEKQFETIKSHTTIGLQMVFFVDERLRDLFKDGVSKHHENLDGTGYPNGLKDAAIPYIARVIRVAESYIALISSRGYRQIQDRDSAIRELHEKSNQYDPKIVQALDEIV